MDLPIDHFRLLGVGPSSDAQTVLRTLQRRQDRAPADGFTAETLQARAELLRASADVLSHSSRRAAYEADLTALTRTGASVVPALEIASSKEVAGLLLLLEAGQPLEAFEMACASLHPPQAPALGSSREADLALLAGLACLGACTDLEQQRRYERAAQLLQQGLQVLQRMGQRPDLRERMNRELERLIPYRILDLLNRDLAASAERGEGLALLEQLVARRGGLEGEADPSFAAEEFRTFFKQIRALLTVQEQVDLFSRWGDAGSPTADFLASTALTASGFAQRKPERIATARERLLASRRSGIEPLLANLSLLLGEVDTARASFEAGASRELRAWAARQSPEPLGQLCAYCRDWLSRDVLPGYRDLEAEADLDAYFSDRDVIAYVEREDRISGRSYAAPLGDADAADPTESAAGGAGPAEDHPFPWNFPPLDFGDGAISAPPPASTSGRGARRQGARLRDSLPSWPGLPFLPRRPRLPRLVVGGAAAAAVLALAGGWLLGKRPAADVHRPAPPPPQTTRLPPAPLLRPARQSQPATAANAGGFVPLRAAQPSEAQVRTLLERWLQAKSQVLRGGAIPPQIDAIARPEPVARLASERRSDSVRGETQDIDVRVAQLQIEQTSPSRIAAIAELHYSDRRKAKDGRVLDSTAPQTIRNLYIFGRDAGQWRFAAQTPAP